MTLPRTLATVAALAAACLLTACMPTNPSASRAPTGSPTEENSAISATAPPATTAAEVASAAPSSSAAAAPPTEAAEYEPGARLVEGPMELPADFFAGVSEFPALDVRDFGAVPDDGVDDTAALQRALDEGRFDADGNPRGESPDDYNGLSKVVYLGAGTFDVSGTLRTTGCCITVRGAGSGATTLRLADGAAGFGDAAAPAPVLQTDRTNEAFRTNVLHLAIDTGSGNPGAVALDYVASNHGAVRNVVLRSGDGTGAVGLDMTRQWPGPLMVADVAVEGFDIGVAIAEPYQVTMERITLRGQRSAGVACRDNNVAIRGLLSENAVPALVSDAQWDTTRCAWTVLDSRLTGTGEAAATAAVVGDGNGTVVLRDVETSGYAAAARVADQEVPTGAVAEFASRGLAAGDAPLGTLDLPIAETPVPADGDIGEWAGFGVPEYNSPTAQENLQAALDSGASTVYFVPDIYLFYHEVVVEVPATVTRIVGFNSTINSDPNGRGGGGLTLVVAEGDAGAAPLVVEGIGYGTRVQHDSARPVALVDGKYVYDSGAAPGPLYLDNVEVHGLTVRAGQQVWARQFNNEGPDTRIVNEGGQLWALGIKTEGPNTLLASTGGANELLGVLVYPAGSGADVLRDETRNRELPIFRVEGDAQLAVTYSVNVFEADGSDRHLVTLRRVAGQTVTDLESADVPQPFGRAGLLRS